MVRNGELQFLYFSEHRKYIMNSISIPIRNIIIVIIIACSISTAQEQFTLEYKLTKGKTYRYRTVTTNSMVNKMNGTSTPTNNTGTVVSRIIVEETAPNGTSVVVALVDSFLSVINGVAAPGPTKDIIGKRARLTVSKLGAIEQREIIDTIIVNGFDMNKLQFNSLFLVLPEKILSTGSRWSDARVDTMVFFGITMINTTTTDYTMTGIGKKNGHDCVTISYTAVSTMAGEGSPQGMKATSHGKTTTTGTTYFDAAKGILVADESTTNGNNSIRLETGMAIDMTTEANSIKTLAE